MLLQGFGRGLEVLVAFPKRFDKSQFARQLPPHQLDAGAEQVQDRSPVKLSVFIGLCGQHVR
ncbi:hypothetical protein D3C84_1071080 [compost metagenome]